MRHVFTAAMLSAALLLAASPVQAAESALVRAVQAGDHATVRALVKQPATVKATEPDGTTALHWAARGGDALALDLLIKAGADVNARTRYGVTPLTLAVRAGRDSNVQALLTAGAKVAVADAGLPEGQTLLMHAARTGNTASMKALLAAGANVNAKETRTETTAVAWAALANRGQAVKLLAERVPGYDRDLEFASLGGAYNRIAPDATAFVHRDCLFNIKYATNIDMSAAESVKESGTRWIERIAAATPWTSGQSYQNYIDPNLADWQQAYYGPNYRRLQQVKHRYDPDRFFTFAQAIGE